MLSSIALGNDYSIFSKNEIIEAICKNIKANREWQEGQYARALYQTMKKITMILKDGHTANLRNKVILFEVLYKACNHISKDYPQTQKEIQECGKVVESATKAYKTKSL